MSVTIKVDSKAVNKMLHQMGEIPDTVINKALPVYKKETPKRTGNARSKTKKQSKDTLISNYGYAGRLDEGWSKQAPKGFTDPTIDYMIDVLYEELYRIT